MRLKNYDQFNINLSSLGLGNIAPMAPIPPIPPIVIGDREIELIDEREMEQAAEAYERVIEAFREQSEHARELRENQRELAYDLRNLSRRKRDLEFELRHASKNSEGETEAHHDLEEIEQEMKQLKAKSEQLSVRAEKEEKSLKEQKQKRKAKADKARTMFYQNLDTTIAQTLCDYGAGLRQLAKNEHVTFVIDLGIVDRHGADKKIHTFSKKDIISCLLEDKTPEELMERADSYYF